MVGLGPVEVQDHLPSFTGQLQSVVFISLELLEVQIQYLHFRHQKEAKRCKRVCALPLGWPPRRLTSYFYPFSTSQNLVTELLLAFILCVCVIDSSTGFPLLGKERGMDVLEHSTEVTDGHTLKFM